MSGLVDAAGLALPGRLARTDVMLAAGTITCLIGPNGSGKTSLLHALAGIGQAAGRVQIAGIDTRKAPPALRRTLLSYLPATRDLHWPLRAHDLIMLGGASPAESMTAAAKLALEPLLDRRADRLSTGERSRVLLARALAAEPHLLLLDEPTANLDPLWQLRLHDLIRAEVAGRDRAVLVAMHDLDSAAAIADRLIVMAHGRIVADGPPQAIIDSGAIGAVFGVERREGRWAAVA